MNLNIRREDVEQLIGAKLPGSPEYDAAVNKLQTAIAVFAAEVDAFEATTGWTLKADFQLMLGEEEGTEDVP